MFAAIVIPNFALQAVLRHEPELRLQPAALVDRDLPKPVIVQLTAVARNNGVIEGLSPSQAMARCDRLIIKTRSLLQESSAAEILLQTAGAFSPNIEATAPGVCTLELKGLGLLKNVSREVWAGKILQAFAQLQLDAQVGFGPTPELALLAGRVARPMLALLPELKGTVTVTLTHPAENGNGKQHVETFELSSDAPRRNEEVCEQNMVVPPPHHLAPPALCSLPVGSLPLTALEPPAQMLEILQRWGIQTIGAFLALGKDRVAERLGTGAAELFDRVSAGSLRPLKLAVPPEILAEQMEFEHEVETIEPLLFVLRRFVEQLSRRVDLVYLVIAEFHLRLRLASGAAYERTFRIPSPTANIETLLRMLQTHLETVRTDSPIVALCLAARPCQPEKHQFGLFESTLRDPNQFAETLARLVALFGPERVGTPELQFTHRPDAFRVGQPFLSPGSAGGKSGNRQTGMFALPLRRFRPPLPAHLEFRSEQPALIRSAIATGAVADWRGPFIISGEWWDASRWTREEWDVQMADGTLYRIFRSSDGCFVEGVYD